MSKKVIISLNNINDYLKKNEIKTLTKEDKEVCLFIDKLCEEDYFSIDEILALDEKILEKAEMILDEVMNSNITLEDLAGCEIFKEFCESTVSERIVKEEDLF